MTTDLTSIVVTIVSSGVGAGVVTFCMNFWKAELDFRKAKIEELYAAIHKYTTEMQLIAGKMRIGAATLDDTSRLAIMIGSIYLLTCTFHDYIPRLCNSP